MAARSTARGRWLGVALACLGMTGAAGCTGEVDVWLADPTPPDPDGEIDIASAELPLDLVEVLQGGTWVALARGPDPYNLLDFSSEPTPVELATLRQEGVRIAHDELPVGPVTQVRLRLVSGEQFVVRDSSGLTYEVEVPEEGVDALVLDVDAEVTANGPLVIDLALDVRASLAATVGGGYAFVPELTAE